MAALARGAVGDIVVRDQRDHALFVQAMSAPRGPFHRAPVEREAADRAVGVLAHGVRAVGVAGDGSDEGVLESLIDTCRAHQVFLRCAVEVFP